MAIVATALTIQAEKEMTYSPFGSLFFTAVLSHLKSTGVVFVGNVKHEHDP